MTTGNLEGQYAGFLTRAVGLVLDYMIVALIGILLDLFAVAVFRAFAVDLNTCSPSTSSLTVQGLLCLFGHLLLILIPIATRPVYFLLFWTLAEQTLGQRVVGVRVVHLDGRRIGVLASLVRWIGYQVCLLTLGLGFLWVLVDDRRMGLHDKLARTCVIYSR
jgi:uncharacterized RDD family membrane protein YckC